MGGVYHFPLRRVKSRYRLNELNPLILSLRASKFWYNTDVNPILKRTITGLAVGVAVIVLILFAPYAAVAPVVALLALLAILEFSLLLKKKVGRWTMPTAIALIVGAAIIACGLWTLAEIAYRLGNVMLLYIVAIVKFSDVGGFAVGMSTAKMMKGGNHKMCPSISPGKSWEGMMGSIAFSCAVSGAFIPATHFAAVVGTAGDLVESKFKRWVGVKDSSALKITNGMGGILDMLDSLIFAPAVLLALV